MKDLNVQATYPPDRWIRHGAAAGSHAAFTVDPAAATDGIVIPGKDSSCTVSINHAAAGARTFTIDVYGYKPDVGYPNATGGYDTVAGSAGWSHLAQITVNEAANGEESHLLDCLPKFNRIYAKATVTVGAPVTIYVDFAFSPHRD